VAKHRAAGTYVQADESGWKEGAIVRAWRPMKVLALKEWDTKGRMGYGLDRLGPGKARRRGEDATKMEVDGPTSKPWL
jgi:hypothetical protein